MTIKNTLWQTPAYEELVFGQKTSDYALVIPVINEGERIRRQLARIADFGVQSDIVIADGGSSGTGSRRVSSRVSACGPC